MECCLQPTGSQAPAGLNPFSSAAPRGASPALQAGPFPGFGSPLSTPYPADGLGFSPLAQGGGISGPQDPQQIYALLAMLTQLLQQLAPQAGGLPGQGSAVGGGGGGYGVADTPGFGSNGGASAVKGAGFPQGRKGGGGSGNVGGGTRANSGGQGVQANDQPLSGSQADKIVQAAKSQVGDPYVFGAPRTPDAKNPSSFDCSSFTQWVYKQATGKTIPGTAETQYDAVKKAGKLNTGNFGNWKVGDLIFYQNTYKPGISHVGIYIGNGKMIEAAGTGKGVVISDANSSYKRQHYAGSGQP